MSGLRIPCIVLLGFLSLSWPLCDAAAARVEGLYSASVQVDDRSPEAREEALTTALEAVLVRVTGSREQARNPALEDLSEQAARYVRSFRYSGAGSDSLLQVTFDGRALSEAVSQRGVGVWGEERPKVLVWLAIDYGGGQRVIVPADSDGPVASRIRAAADERGLPVSLPLMDAQDRESITFADIWGGFTEAVRAASDRYAPDAILVGRARRGQGGTLRVEWKLYFGAELLASRGRIDAGLQEAADFFARQFVVGGNDAAATGLALRIMGVTELEQYARVLAHLEGLSLVESVTLREARDDELMFDVNLKGSRAQLQRALALGRVVEEVGPAVPSPLDSRELRLRPVR